MLGLKLWPLLVIEDDKPVGQKRKAKETSGILDLFAKQRKRVRKAKKRALLRDEVEEYMEINFDPEDDDCTYTGSLNTPLPSSEVFP